VIRRPRSIVWWPLLGVLATGCYEWVKVPPGELAKLDQRAPRYLAEPMSQPELVAVVQGENGKLLDVEGDFAVKVTTSTQSMDFASPIRCAVTPERLQIAEGDAEPMSFPRADLKSTEVYHYQKTLSRTVWVVGIAAVVLTFALVGRHALENGGP
jgi:hypothetical protein